MHYAQIFFLFKKTNVNVVTSVSKQWMQKTYDGNSEKIFHGWVHKFIITFLCTVFILNLFYNMKVSAAAQKLTLDHFTNTLAWLGPRGPAL